MSTMNREYNLTIKLCFNLTMKPSSLIIQECISKGRTASQPIQTNLKTSEIIKHLVLHRLNRLTYLIIKNILR